MVRNFWTKDRFRDSATASEVAYAEACAKVIVLAHAVVDRRRALAGELSNFFEADCVGRSPQKKSPPTLKLRWAKAEREGFEPSVQV